MKTWALSVRTAKEILRDPLNLCFGLGFPLVLLGMLSAIQANIPVSMFELEHLTPGVTVFGLSFLSLFSAVLVSKDRESALLQRLYTTPLTAVDFIVSYMLPLIPMAVAMGAVCYGFAMVLGLTWNFRILAALISLVPVGLFYICLGLICGSAMSSKQVGGICGALLTNLSAWLSGIWFDVEMLGGPFRKAASCLPFLHAVELERGIFRGNLSEALPHLWWVLGYTAAAMVLAVVLFLRQMKRQ